MANTDRSILIVGAGPVGLMAAIELRRRGFRPRIIDAEEGPTPLNESRALAVNLRSLQLLGPSGLDQRILAEAHQVRQMRMFAGDRPLATIDTMDVGGKYRGLHVLPLGRTERIQLQRLAEFDLAPEWRTSLEALSGANGRPSVTVVRPDGSREQASFDIVIGADGAHSVVRKAVGLPFAGTALEETFYIADYRYAEDVDTSFGEAHFYDPGVIARLPSTSARYVTSQRSPTSPTASSTLPRSRQSPGRPPSGSRSGTSSAGRRALSSLPATPRTSIRRSADAA